MRKIKILALMLVFVMLLSTVVACGSNTSQGEKDTSSEAITQSSKEETKAPEITTSAESTTAEASTKKESGVFDNMPLNYSLYPISEETKAMLIEKLTNLVLVKGQEFDVYALPFKENEMLACYLLEGILAHHTSSILDGTGVIKCRISRFEIYKIEDEGTQLMFYFKKGGSV